MIARLEAEPVFRREISRIRAAARIALVGNSGGAAVLDEALDDVLIGWGELWAKTQDNRRHEPAESESQNA